MRKYSAPNAFSRRVPLVNVRHDGGAPQAT